MYPTLTRVKTQELASELVAGGEPDIDGVVVWQGGGPELNLDEIAELAGGTRQGWEKFIKSRSKADLDKFEGQVAGRLHFALREVPLGIIDDPGFWRYLTLRYFWWFVIWRQSPAFARCDYRDFGKYIDGMKPTECVLLRMYLRGQITLMDEGYALADEIPYSADFWRSHILRVRTGSSPVMARAFAKEQATEKMSTDPLRLCAKSLNRLWTNVVLYSYDSDEADAVIRDLRAQLEQA
jgi:hypothetical protein